MQDKFVSAAFAVLLSVSGGSFPALDTARPCADRLVCGISGGSTAVFPPFAGLSAAVTTLLSGESGPPVLSVTAQAGPVWAAAEEKVATETEGSTRTEP